MSEQKVMNRWWVVVGALLIQLCLGAIYAWGAFTGATAGTRKDRLSIQPHRPRGYSPPDWPLLLL